MKITHFIAVLLKPPYLVFLLIIQFGVINALAETTEQKPEVALENGSTQEISKESLQVKIDALTARKGLDEALKTKVLEIYQSAQDELANINSFNERTDVFQSAIKQAPDSTKKLQKDIDQASEKPAKPNASDFIKIPVEELTQRLVIEQDKVNQLDEQINKLKNDLSEQINRPNLIRQETLLAKQKLDEARKAIETTSSNAATTNDSKLEIDAQQIYLKIQIDARTAELNMLDAENTSYSPRLSLLKARLQLLELQKNAFNPLISTIENVLTDLRLQEEKNRQDALSQAEKELDKKPKIIQEVTRENIQYNQKLQIIHDKISLYEAEKTKTEARINDIDANYNSAAKKIDLASLSPPLGKILHEQRRDLLNQDQFILQSESIQEETANTNLDQLIIEEKLKQINDVDLYLRQKMDIIDKKLPMPQRMMIQAELRVLLNSQNDLLTKLSIAYNDYLRTLGDFDFSRQQKRSKVEKFALYLDEHLLWVRSSEALGRDTFEGIYKSTKWLLSPYNWKILLKNLANIPRKNPLLTLFALFNISILFALKKHTKQRLALVSTKVGKVYTDKFYYTIAALIYTVILVVPLPLIIGYISWFLSNVPSGNFTQAVGIGLKHVALIYFFFQFCCRLFEPTGIMRQHFQWQENTAALVRKQLLWLRFVVIPCAFILRTTLASEVPTHADHLGRFALNIGAIAVVVFLAKLLHPRRGLLQVFITEHPDGWITKLSYVFYSAAFVPLIVIGFSVAGYFLSAVELEKKIMSTLWLVILMILVYEIALRWLTLANRQLAIKNLQQKLKHEAESEKHTTITGSENPILPAEEQEVDIPTINTQTLKILNVLFCLSLVIVFSIVWKNILPAFSFLEQIELWQNKAIVNNKETYQSITLVNLLLAFVYSVITVIAVRNFSGVMELLLFRRVTMDAGSRYAVNKIISYLLTIIGFFSVTNELGFSWSQVQWLVAALSVGLGFGLQEIFANFVSGIILLFERPIRVGDIVTIGDVSGKVSRIHMRATTLIDFDQKELIVPNKTFITTQLVNWTLSDATTRVVIPVSIAYDSDIELAHKVILEAVHATTLVLKEPAPSVMLVAFRDSSLEFSVRVFVSETINRIPVTHELHTRLLTALREHHIELPFPQRDIHIRSITPEGSADKNVFENSMMGACNPTLNDKFST